MSSNRIIQTLQLTRPCSLPGSRRPLCRGPCSARGDRPGPGGSPSPRHTRPGGDGSPRDGLSTPGEPWPLSAPSGSGTWSRCQHNLANADQMQMAHYKAKH